MFCVNFGVEYPFFVIFKQKSLKFIMSNIRRELVYAALNRAFTLTDQSIYNNSEKQHEFRKQTILADESPTDDEKLEAIRFSTRYMDYYKLIRNEGTKRICENCQ